MRLGGSPLMELTISRFSWMFGKALMSWRVYGCVALLKMSAVVPLSTTSPAYMTTPLSQVSAMTERSWLMRMNERSSSLRRRPMSSRICACTMTSSAVVGSSPMTSLGLHASAMAIMARWRMPPESWCGKSITRLGLMPTRSNSSRARTMACFSLRPSCSWMGSAICLPVSLTGFSAFIAPWKMMLISFQRILLMPNSVRLARFLPSKRISPLTMRPFSGRSLSRERAAVVLPQPDSPARPRLSPG